MRSVLGGRAPLRLREGNTMKFSVQSRSAGLTKKSVGRRSLMLGACALAVGVAFAGSAFAADAKKTLAFVVNVPADFWTIARRGTEKAQAELPNYNIEFYIPGEMSAAAQKKIMEDLLARNVAGLAISPVNPDNSTEILNQVASQAVLFTHDADAAKSNRVMYIGTDNVDAGRKAG